MTESKREKEKLQGYMSRDQEVTKLYEIEAKKCEHLQSNLERAETELENVIHEFDAFKKSTALGSGGKIMLVIFYFAYQLHFRNILRSYLSRGTDVE